MPGETLSDPIPEPVVASGLTIGIQDWQTIPASATSGAAARLNDLREAPDGSGRLFVNDLRGEFWVIKDNVPTLFADLSQLMSNFQDNPGLGSGFGNFAFHPEFATNGIFYTTHTEVLGSGTPDFPVVNGTYQTTALEGVITEWTMSDPGADVWAGTQREVLRIEFPGHFHSIQEIAFNPHANPSDADYGLLYLSVGDGGQFLAGTGGDASHRLDSPLGTILRIDPLGNTSANGQYGIPTSNPYATDGDANTLGEIYAWGFRNPHRFTFDEQSGKILVGDIGQDNIEEVNLLVPGADYGWYLREGTFEVGAEATGAIYGLPQDDASFGYTYPVAQYDHDEGFAIVGGHVYRGTAIPELQGQYVFGDIVTGRLFHVPVEDLILGQQAQIHELTLVDDSGSVVTLPELVGSNRADLRFGIDDQGEIYVITKTDGQIRRLFDATPGSVPAPSDYTNAFFGDAGNNPIQGTAQDDWIEGGAGTDNLNGLAGDDYIKVGSGNDWHVLGGAGADLFHFEAGDNGVSIADWESGIDKVFLAGGLEYTDLSVTVSSHAGSTSLNFWTPQGDRLIIRNVELGDIGSADFITSTGPGSSNQAPIADNANVTGSEDTLIQGTLSATDPDGDAIKFHKDTDPGNGTVTVNPDGSFAYQPNSNFAGTDSFDYRVSDPDGAVATATVSVTVEPVNDAPIAENANVSGSEDTLIQGILNASDPDGDAITFHKATDPGNGSVTVNPDGTFAYTPGLGFIGSDSFDFEVRDPSGASATATTFIEVRSDTAPAPSDYTNAFFGDAGNNPIQGTTLNDWIEGGAGTDNLNGLAGADYIKAGSGNDWHVLGGAGADLFHFEAGDNGISIADWETGIDKVFLAGGLEYTDLSVTVSSHAGSTSLNFWTPQGDRLIIRNVELGDIASADFITSTGPGSSNQAPIADNANVTGSEDTLIQGTLTASDPDGDAITFHKDTDPGNGTVTVNPDGSFAYQPNSNFAGTDSFDYRVIDPDGAVATATVSVTVEPQSQSELLLIVTMGQSLTQGATYWPDREVLSPTALYPNKALTLDYNVDTYNAWGWRNVEVQPNLFEGFTPHVEYLAETHTSAMLNSLIAEYSANSAQAPTIAHFNVGVPGTSVVELSADAEQTYATLAEGFSNTVQGDLFVSTENGTFDYYLNTGNGTTFSYGALDAPFAFINFKTQLDLAYNEAVAQGYTVQDRVVINWIQGQSDRYNIDPDYGHGYLLDRMFSEIDQYADTIFGKDIETIAMVSQHRGYDGKEVATDQIEYVVENNSAYFGAPEFQFQASEPASVGNSYSHLTGEGYYMLGNTIGLKLYEALEGNGDDPIMISTIDLVTPSEVLLTFSGVEGQLVDDPDTAYRPGSGLVAPENFGFGTTDSLGTMFSDAPNVTSAQIENANQVRLFFDSAIEDEFRLYLGRNDSEDLGDPIYAPSAGQGFGGSTLRDSETHSAMSPSGSRILDDDLIYEYAPVQYVSIDPDDFI